jgi:hypothetical protein
MRFKSAIHFGEVSCAKLGGNSAKTGGTIGVVFRWTAFNKIAETSAVRSVKK